MQGDRQYTPLLSFEKEQPSEEEQRIKEIKQFKFALRKSLGKTIQEVEIEKCH